MSFPVFAGICFATLVIGGLYTFYRLFEALWYGSAWVTAGSRTAAALKFTPVVAIFTTLILLGSACRLNAHTCPLSTPIPWPSAVLVSALFFDCLLNLAAALIKGRLWRFRL